MNPKSSPINRHRSLADTTEAVEHFMQKLEHPLKTEIQAVRDVVLGADSAIAEGIKWNAPSFRTTEYFATVNLREKAGVGLILHLGAKVRDMAPGSLQLEDPQGLLRWLAKDRAMIVFENMPSIVGSKPAFEHIIRQWIERV